MKRAASIGPRVLGPRAEGMLGEVVAAGVLDIRAPSSRDVRAAAELDRWGFARLSGLRYMRGDNLAIWATTAGRDRSRFVTCTVITTGRPPRRVIAPTRCRVCTASPVLPFAPPCGFCLRGWALKVCGDHDAPEALPGCPCFRGDPLAGDLVVRQVVPFVAPAIEPRRRGRPATV